MTDRSTAPDLDPLDRIDRSIEIAAGADVVWGLVSRPGWWISEAPSTPSPTSSTSETRRW